MTLLLLNNSTFFYDEVLLYICCPAFKVILASGVVPGYSFIVRVYGVCKRRDGTRFGKGGVVHTLLGTCYTGGEVSREWVLSSYMHAVGAYS